jgi:branched-chain amino acid transport system substrate-binding protein
MMRRAIVLILAAAAFSASAHHAPGPIKMAVVLSITGPASPLGVPQLKALQLAVERLNREGGLLTHQLQLNVADDGSDPAKAAAEAKRLATPENADILIGGSATSTALAILPVMEAAKIPFIALATGSRVTEPSRAWVFSTPPTESVAVLRILDDVARSGGKRLALLSMDTASGRTARRDVRQYTDPASLYFRKSGIALGADLAFAPVDADAAARAMEQVVRGDDADAVLVVASGSAAAAAARRHAELGSKSRLYFSHAAATPDFLKLAGEAANGARMTAPPMMVVDLLGDGDPQKKPILEFAAAYRERHGEAPPPAAGYALDALMLAVNAIREAKSLDFNQMRQALEATRGYAGVTGTYSFRASDHHLDDAKSLRLVEVRGGRLSLLD